MKIDKNNYEAYLLDYLEGNITPEDKAILFSFLDDNPELKSNLDVPVDLILPNPNIGPSFDKASLKKHEAEEFDLSPIEYLYIKEQEEGLTEVEKNEQSILEPNEDKRSKERKLYSISFLKPDLKIHLSNKSQLKHFTINKFISQIRLQHVAAVIAVLLIASALWFTPKQYTRNSMAVIVDREETSTNTESDLIAKTEPKVDKTPLIIKTPPSKDSLMQIAKDPMGKQKNINKNKTAVTQPKKQIIVAQKLSTRSDINLNQTKEINGYEYALNVMMPQYLSNNILSRELAEIYKKIETDEEVPTKNIALVEGGVKFINFFSKDAVSLDKYYDKEGNLIGYNLQGNGLSVKRNAQ
ncbi:hypothetical protein [Carboxylicivirga linearis]|uniref:Uncharacterized protein n=1 Tax=Carboxylicivirga linearis TaxID=1628157 RepID=A0ABS5JUY9_9BACT|nr:hypothetical protein [Carboxylicivirga linearis]MBS2098721.1 hypothetical protein [Carboxylicivirga linearis]